MFGWSLSAWIATIVAVVILILLVRWLRQFFRLELRSIGSLLWMIWCWGYTMRWRFRFLLRTWTGKTAAGVLLLGSIYVLLDVVLAVLRKIDEQSTTIAAHAVPDRTSFPPLKIVPSLPPPPLSIELALIALAVLVFRIHWREWKLQMREAHLPAGLKKLIQVSQPYLRNPELDEDARSNFFLSVMNEVTHLLTTEGQNEKYCMSLVTKDADGKHFSVIRIFPPDTRDIDVSGKLEFENSAAGLAFRENHPIYVPSTRHMSGINMTSYQSVGLVYNPKVRGDPGPALMCVPVTNGLDHSTSVAVLNVSCSKRSAFEPLDFDIVSLGVSLVADKVLR